MNQRECTKCKEMVEYPNGFNKHGLDKNGTQKYNLLCKGCERENQREYRVLNLEKYNASKRALTKKWQYENPKFYKSRIMCYSATRRSLIHNIPYNIDSTYVASICDDYCCYCLKSFSYLTTDQRPNLPSLASLDRINLSGGYIKGNVQVIDYRCNSIKSDLLPEEWEIPLRIAQHLKYLHDGEPIPTNALPTKENFNIT